MKTTLSKTALGITGFALVISTFLAAVPIFAEEVTHEGQVVKLENGSTLYYITSEGKRYVYPNEKTYKTWFSDFDDVVIVTAEELAEYPLAGNIRYRPGVLLIKIQTDPKVYAISRGGVLRWVKSEQLARNLYGENWGSLIDDIAASFFTNYIVGLDIDEEEDFDPDAEVDDNDTVEINRGLAIGHIANGKIAQTVRCHGKFKRACFFGEETNGDGEGETNEENDGNKVVVCHIPPGNPANKKSIDVGRSALTAHLRHGDTAGSCDGDEGEGEGDDETAPVISDISIEVTDTTAIITWTTDEDSSSDVEYADESLLTASSTELVTDTALVTSHSVEITGLTTETTYYFTVSSTDSNNNSSTSDEDTFTTVVPDETAPVISNVSVEVINTTATITWTTNEDSDSEVEYATESLATASTTELALDGSSVTGHSIEITNLLPETIYFFKVSSTDNSDNKATSNEDTFTTSISADETAPIITNIQVTSTSTGVFFTWTTDEDSDSEVEYATESLATASSTDSVTDASLVTSHSLEISLNNVTSSTTYFFVVKSTDESNNEAISSEDVFVTIQ